MTRPVSFLLLSALIAFGGCAQRTPTSPDEADSMGGASSANSEIDPEQIAEVLEQQQTVEYNSDEEYVSPVLQEGLAKPKKKENPKKKPPREVPLVVENPPISEDFLFPEGPARMMVSDTVMTGKKDDHAPPLFDAVGEQAKEQYVKAAYLNQRGYSTQALQHFYSAVERDPDNLWLKNRAARAALFQNDLPRTQKLSEEVLEADPDNYQAMLTLATLNLLREKKEDARQWYLKIIEIKPDNIEALENLTRLAYDEKDFEKTKEYASHIMEVTNRNLNAILWHAEASALTGDITYAAELYERLVRYRPMLISRLSDMGIRLVRHNRLEEAKELFRRGIAIRPETEVLRLQWEALLREDGGEGAVDQGYQQLAGEHPLDLDIQELYAGYLERTNENEKLKTQRERMLEIEPRHVPSLLSLGRMRLQADDYEGAKKYFERAVAAGPQQASTFREMAMVYIANEDYERAEELMQEAMILEPSDAENQIALAALYEQTKNLKKSEEALKKALDLSPANEIYLRLLAQFYRDQNRMEEASQVFEQVLAVNPEDVSAQIMLGRIYFELENDDALDRLEKAAARVVTDKEGFYLNYAYLAYEFAAWRRAVWGYEHALEESPDDIHSRMALALSYLHLGENKLALQTMERGRQHVENDPEMLNSYLYSLMGIYNQADETDKAIETARKLVKDNPDELMYYTALAGQLVDAEREEEAQEVLNNIIRQFAVKKPFETKRVRAEVYRQMKEYDRSAGVLLPLVDEAPDPLEIIYELALTYGDKEDLEKATRYYEHVIDEVANADRSSTQTEMLINAYNNLAYLLSEKNVDLEKASEYAEKAYKLRPGAEYILDTVGWVSYRRGDYGKAEEYLKKAEKRSFPDPEIYSHLGDLYRDTSREELAIKYYEKALALSPDDKDLRQKLDALTPAVGSVPGNDSKAP